MLWLSIALLAHVLSSSAGSAAGGSTPIGNICKSIYIYHVSYDAKFNAPLLNPELRTESGFPRKRKMAISSANSSNSAVKAQTGRSLLQVAPKSNSAIPLKFYGVNTSYFTPPSHPCQGIHISTIRFFRKRRACPVCYLPVESATPAMPAHPPTHPSRQPGVTLQTLAYATSSHPSEQLAISERKLPRFAGYQSWNDRKESFQILGKSAVTVHCGFVHGKAPGVGTDFELTWTDRVAMKACSGIVVVSALFGNHDLLQQPMNVSSQSERTVCFFTFVDDQNYNNLKPLGSVLPNGTLMQPIKVGLWRIIRVTKLPFKDPRRNGRVPKLLLHRLFPNARYSIWVDAKMKLYLDPLMILERYLWRGNATLAISKHFERKDVFQEGEANKVFKKNPGTAIDEQLSFYRKDGMEPYSIQKLPIQTDVPESSIVIREHTPLTNLFSCLWFNEVNRFTPRDQLSFGYVRDKLLSQVPWSISMFDDCERRTFAAMVLHKYEVVEKLVSLGFTQSKIAKLMNVYQLSLEETVDYPHAWKRAPSKRDTVGPQCFFSRNLVLHYNFKA